jgi:hypothetical protein
MLAVAMSQAVLALENHAHVAIGWVSGIISFIVGVWLAGDDLFLRIEIGLVASSTISLTYFTAALKHHLNAV